MLDYVTGTVAKITQTSVIVDVCGIGFTVHMPQNALSSLPSVSTSITLHVSLVIREFSQTIYGFRTENERNLFEKLLNINGIGPKLAISIVGTLTFDELYQSCTTKDYSALCTVPGVGKKTAERLVIELKDTLSQFVTNVTPMSAPRAHLSHDALRALMNLGYSQATAQKAIQKALEQEKEGSLAKVITTALSYL